jgi:hypothetical protein
MFPPLDVQAKRTQEEQWQSGWVEEEASAAKLNLLPNLG